MNSLHTSTVNVVRLCKLNQIDRERPRGEVASSKSSMSNTVRRTAMSLDNFTYERLKLFTNRYLFEYDIYIM